MLLENAKSLIIMSEIRPVMTIFAGTKGVGIDTQYALNWLILIKLQIHITLSNPRSTAGMFVFFSHEKNPLRVHD